MTRLTEPMLGLWDTDGDTLRRLQQCYYGPLISVGLTESPDANARGLAFLVDKDLLLSRSTHVIVAMQDIGSLPVLIGAVRALLAGALRGVLVVGSIDLDLLYRSSDLDAQTQKLEDQVADGRLRVVTELARRDVEALLS